MVAVENVHGESLAQRGERRFLIDEMMAHVILDILSRHLNLAPEEWSTPWRTTVYCDTPDARIFRSAKSGAGVFMRFREYHTKRPSAVFTGEETWLEFKPVEQFTGKTRYAFASRSIPALLRGEIELDPELGQPDGYLQQLLQAGVRPVFATQYHRLAYATPGDIVRITADLELTYHVLPHWDAGDPQAVPSPLAPAFFTEFGVVVEMKWLRELPKWAVMVAEFLGAYTLSGGENKFLVGMRHLQGRPSDS